MKRILLSVQALMALGITNATTEGAEAADVEAKILELSGKVARLEGEKAALELANQTMKDAQEAAATQAANEMVNLAIAQGKITADKKEDFLNLAKANAALAKSTLEAIPAKTNFGSQVQTPTGNAEVKTLEDFQKLSLEDQMTFKSGNPDQYKKLFS